MLEQELIDDLKQYLVVHYRPEGATIRAFARDDEDQHKTAGPLGGLAAAVISADFFKGIDYLVSKLGISKSHFAKIRNNPQYHPTKETVLAFVVALHLYFDEAADLLKRAGYAMSERYLGDMIVAYFLEAGRYNIDEVNEALYMHDCKPLTNWRESKS